VDMLKTDAQDLKSKLIQSTKEIRCLEVTNSNLIEELNYRVSEIGGVKNLNESLKKNLELYKLGFPMDMAQTNSEYLLSELSKTLELYRSRLISAISSIRGQEWEQKQQTDLVIEQMTMEMQQYSILLIKTQMALDHKEQDCMSLRCELEETNMAKKESVNMRNRKIIEDSEILIAEKDRLIQDLVKDKRAMKKKIDDFAKKIDEFGKREKINME
jgi:hypothetical protein